MGVVGISLWGSVGFWLWRSGRMGSAVTDAWMPDLTFGGRGKNIATSSALSYFFKNLNGSGETTS